MPDIIEGEQGLASAVESGYGVDATPTDAVNAMRVKANLKPDFQSEDLNFDSGFAGEKGAIGTVTIMSGDLEGYLAPSGVAGTAPAITPLLRSAGFNVTPDATPGDEHVDIALTRPQLTASCSHRFYRGTNVRAVLGAMSDCELHLKNNESAKLKFPKFTGLYAPQQTGALPDLNLSAFTAPLVPTAESWTQSSIFGRTEAVSEVMLKLGNEVVFSNENGRVISTGRKVTIELTIPEPNVATYDWETRMFDKGVIALQTGVDVADAGRILELHSPNAQLVGLDRTTIDKVDYLKMTFKAVATAPNNEVSMILR